MQTVFPWPRSDARRAAIDAARAEKERSRASAAQAAGIAGQIRRMAQENHFAQAIAEQLIARHQREGR